MQLISYFVYLSSFLTNIKKYFTFNNSVFAFQMLIEAYVFIMILRQYSIVQTLGPFPHLNTHQ